MWKLYEIQGFISLEFWKKIVIFLQNMNYDFFLWENIEKSKQIL